MAEFKSDIEIARAAKKKPIMEVGAKLGIPTEHLLPYGHDKAKISAEFIASKPANDGLRDMDARMVIQAGGLPIKFGKALVGGIGVGGAPSGDIDAGCAAAGLKAIGAAE